MATAFKFPVSSPAVYAVGIIVLDVMASCVVCALMVVFLDVVMPFVVISFSDVTFEVVESSVERFAVVCLIFGVLVAVTTETKFFV